jgi:Undecaprenyl-phosphate galactose phosphotransferase WbaP
MAIKKTFNRLKTVAEILITFAIDIFSLLAIFQLSVIMRTEMLPRILAGFPEELPFRSFIKIWWIFLVWIFFFCYEGLYTKRFSFWDEIKALWKIAIFSTAGIFIIVSIGKLSGEISRTIIILMGLFSILLLPPIRIALKIFLRKLGFLKRRVLILGAGKTGKLIASALGKEPNYGYEVIGFLDDDPEKVGKAIDGIKVHRGVDRAVTYLKGGNITDVFIAMPGAGKEKLQGLINNLQHKVERILFVPDMFGIAVLGTNLQHFFHEQAFALEMKNNLSRPLNIFIKKCFDLFISVLLMPFLFIPIVIIAVLIKLDSKGPAIFSQERIGKKGKRFRCFKFRTMYADAEDKLTELLKSNPGTKKEWEQTWKIKDDPRITRIGKFLRKTSLDELPQLINVLRGEMSLVGPRPYLLRELDFLENSVEIIFNVHPGITGLWQVSGRSNTNYNYRIALDSWYVRNWNLWLDIVVLFKTARVVLKREGAY